MPHRCDACFNGITAPAGEVDPQVALQAHRNTGTVQVHAGKAPLIGGAALRRQHAFVDQFNNPVGLRRTGAADVGQGQLGLLFKNVAGDFCKLAARCHGLPPGLARGLKALNCSAMSL